MKHDDLVLENTISLKQFPPKLRKLAKYLLQSEKPVTISQACRELGLNRESIGTLMWRSKQKGNDFNEFIKQLANSYLNANRLAVYEKLVEGAVSSASTSHNDRKTYLQLTGDIKATTDINVNVLTIGVNQGTGRPADIPTEKGIVDAAPPRPEQNKSN